MFYRFLLAMLLVIPVNAVSNTELTEQQVRELLKVKMRTVELLAFNPTLVNAVRKQNEQNLDLQQIKIRDEKWRKSKQMTPFKLSMQVNKAGRLLKRTVATNASINEAFLTDNKGANVAAYPATSDYWQGDEEKWSASFNEGSGVMFIGPVEKDASTNTYAVQISAPVKDQKKTIGVLVVGVTLKYMESRHARR